MAKAVSTSVVSPVAVSVQTLRGTQGVEAAVAIVDKAVKAFNATLPKGSTMHVIESFEAVPANTKGMQWQLATLATVARLHDATMIRLSVHNGMVALCGTKTAIEATRKTMIATKVEFGTLVNTSYDANTDGNRLGYTNAFLCGCPAGLQVAARITPTLAYGLGILFDFPAPGTGAAYVKGQLAAAKAYVPVVAKAPKVKAVKPVEAAPVEPVEDAAVA